MAAAYDAGGVSALSLAGEYRGGVGGQIMVTAPLSGAAPGRHWDDPLAWNVHPVGTFEH